MRQKKSNAQNPVRPVKKTSRPAAKKSSPFEKFYKEKDKKKDEESFTENRRNSRSKSPSSFTTEDKPKRPYKKEETKSYGNRDEKPKRSYGRDETKSYGSRDEKPKRSYGRDETKSYGSRDEKPKRSYGRDETKSYGSRDEKPKRSYGRDETKSYGSRDEKQKRSYGRDETKSYGSRDEKPKRSYGRDETKSYGSRDEKPKRSYGRDETRTYGSRDDKPRTNDGTEKGRTVGSDFKKKDDFFDVGSSKNKSLKFDDKPKRSYERDEHKSYGNRNEKPFGSVARKEERTGSYSKYDNDRSSSRGSNSYGSDRSSYRGSNDARYDRGSRAAFNRSSNNEYEDFKRQFFGKNADDYKPRDKKSKKEDIDSSGVLWLNKFLAQAGVCSRRKAAELIKDGTITVNGVKETNPAYEVKPEDVITYLGKPIQIEEKKIYLIMNKPKNVITTVEDEKGRKTVLDLIKEDYAQRLFPVGRLDRQTTGLLLLTNDGELTKKLTHPSHQIKKVYSAVLDKNLALKDLEKIKDGVELEDGKAEVDSVDYITAGKKNEIGIELHSGKNRIVRRIFESLGYEVEKLDRTLFAGLTKKDLPRGFYRELTEKEVIMLKHFTNMRKG